MTSAMDAESRGHGGHVDWTKLDFGVVKSGQRLKAFFLNLCMLPQPDLRSFDANCFAELSEAKMPIDEMVLKALREDPEATDKDLAMKVFHIDLDQDEDINLLERRAGEIHAAINRLTKLPLRQLD